MNGNLQNVGKMHKANCMKHRYTPIFRWRLIL
jgi:hypothetical protein